MSTEPLSTEYWVSVHEMGETPTPLDHRVYLANDIDAKFAALRAENEKLRLQYLALDYTSQCFLERDAEINQALRAELAKYKDSYEHLVHIDNQEVAALEHDNARLVEQASQLATELGELQQAYTEMEACKREFRQRAEHVEVGLDVVIARLSDWRANAEQDENWDEYELLDTIVGMLALES